MHTKRSVPAAYSSTCIGKILGNVINIFYNIVLVYRIPSP